MPLLQISDLIVLYGEIEALRGVSLSVDEGQVVTLLGANGAGKSTTLRAISGLAKPTAGEILFDGKSIAGLGPEAIGEHNLALAHSFASELGLAEPASPILRVPVDDADSAVERLKRAGVACSARSGSIRFAFHLYNDEQDVALALEALRPTAAVRSDA